MEEGHLESSVFERGFARSNGREIQAELVLLGLRPKDAGLYHCVISNDVGTAYSHRSVVVVHGKLNTNS